MQKAFGSGIGTPDWRMVVASTIEFYGGLDKMFVPNCLTMTTCTFCRGVIFKILLSKIRQDGFSSRVHSDTSCSSYSSSYCSRASAWPEVEGGFLRVIIWADQLTWVRIANPNLLCIWAHAARSPSLFQLFWLFPQRVLLARSAKI